MTTETKTPSFGDIKTPPKDTIKPKTPPTRKNTGGRQKNLTQPLEELFTTIGTVVMVANEADGLAIIQGTPRLANSLNELAKQNPAVRKNIERLLAGSAWSGVLASVGAIALPIMANHNLLPVELPNFMMPDIPKDSPDGS